MLDVFVYRRLSEDPGWKGSSGGVGRPSLFLLSPNSRAHDPSLTDPSTGSKVVDGRHTETHIERVDILPILLSRWNSLLLSFVGRLARDKTRTVTCSTEILKLVFRY